MHGIILELSQNQVVVPNGRNMFATYSKSRSERAIAGHAGWIKRAVSKIGQEALSLLDIEYNTGTVWMGTSTIASATRPSEAGTNEEHLLREEVEGHQV